VGLGLAAAPLLSLLRLLLPPLLHCLVLVLLLQARPCPGGRAGSSPASSLASCPRLLPAAALLPPAAASSSCWQRRLCLPASTGAGLTSFAC